MIKHYELSGQRLPVKFSHLSVYDYEVMTGRPFTADLLKVLGAMSVDNTTVPIIELMDIIRCGLIEGGEEEKKPFTKSSRDLFAMCGGVDNMTVLGEIIVQCTESMPRAKEGEEKPGETIVPAADSLTGSGS